MRPDLHVLCIRSRHHRLPRCLPDSDSSPTPAAASARLHARPSPSFGGIRSSSKRGAAATARGGEIVSEQDISVRGNWIELMNNLVHVFGHWLHVECNRSLHANAPRRRRRQTHFHTDNVCACAPAWSCRKHQVNG